MLKPITAGVFKDTKIYQNSWFYPLSILTCMIVGVFLRFSRLGVLPPWTDEVATMVFSLGNSFKNVPLNEFISIDTILQPLIPRSEASFQDVITNLFAESTHPPVYFLLTHFWLKFFPLDDGLVSLWGARSLSVIFGVLAIPAMFFLVWKVFNSRLAGLMAAILMTFSPYGIFLGQQARHYTLVILFIIISLTCFIKAAQSLFQEKPLPTYLSITWIIANILGIATHYFFALTLAVELVILIVVAWQQGKEKFAILATSSWKQIYLVLSVTLLGCLVWLPALLNIYGKSPTTWVYDGDPISDWISPLLRLLLWLLSMVIVLPSAMDLMSLSKIIIVGAITLGFLLWITPSIIYGLKLQKYENNSRLATNILASYLGIIIILILIATYVFQADLTLVPRFHFVYFPVIIALLGASLADCWRRDLKSSKLKKRRHSRPSLPQIFRPNKSFTRVRVMAVFVFAFLSSLTMIFNFGYLQNHRPDLMVSVIENVSQTNPAVIITTHRHHGQTGRMMGLAWGFKYSPATISPQFFLADLDESQENYTEAVNNLEVQIKDLPKPVDLWLVNFRSEIDLSSQGCHPNFEHRDYAGQYKYKLYHCQ